jgi:hypothetical protein
MSFRHAIAFVLLAPLLSACATVATEDGTATVARIDALSGPALVDTTVAAWIAAGCVLPLGTTPGDAAARDSVFAAQMRVMGDYFGLSAAQRAAPDIDDALAEALFRGEETLTARGRLVKDNDATRLVPCAA